MMRTIAHPTDFTREGVAAFEHALALAVAHRAALHLVHVHAPGAEDSFAGFPHVRDTLQRWGMIGSGAKVEDIERETGVAVRKTEIRDVDAVDGLSRFLASHRPDLVVMATHGRAGIERLLKGSVSTQVAQEVRVPVLYLGPNASGCIDENGGLRIARVLVPVDHDPPAGPAVRGLRDVLGALDPELDLLHVGTEPPSVSGPDGELPVRSIDGDVVGTIAVAAMKADLLAMPTAGRQGLGDILRGSTTERVLRDAPCPVLALPARD